MTQIYSDPKRESDPYSLPDVEVFWNDGVPASVATVARAVCSECRAEVSELAEDATAGEEDICVPCFAETRKGWWWWTCSPGCMPDSDPVGPFGTKAEAIDDAREGMDDGSADADYKGCAECEDKGLTHVDYPHEAGYLLDCAACEDHCHCGRADGRPVEGRAACVFVECEDEDE